MCCILNEMTGIERRGAHSLLAQQIVCGHINDSSTVRPERASTQSQLLPSYVHILLGMCVLLVLQQGQNLPDDGWFHLLRASTKVTQTKLECRVNVSVFNSSNAGRHGQLAYFGTEQSVALLLQPLLQDKFTLS